MVGIKEIDVSKITSNGSNWFFEGQKLKMTKEVREKYDYYRFWSKVDLRANQHTCWNWIAGKNKYGYGSFMFKDDTLSNRIAYRLYYGDFDKTLCVLHKCDNPSCCNPNHLYLGTKKDNSRDKAERDRMAHLKGEQNGSSKLTEDQVIKIVSLIKSGEKISSISKTYNVSFQQILNIKKGRCWSHITMINRVGKGKKIKKYFNVYKDGQHIGRWGNHDECAKYLNVFRSGITKALNNAIKSCRGYIFKYE